MTDEITGGVGTVEGLATVPGSGLAQILVRDDDGELHVFPCDAGPTLRALSNLSPSLRRGASVRVRLSQGVRVRYALDHLGLLATLSLDDEGA